MSSVGRVVNEAAASNADMIKCAEGVESGGKTVLKVINARKACRKIYEKVRWKGFYDL